MSLPFLWLLPGLYLGWGLGANDTANVFGTAVSARIVRYRTAIVLTAIFVLAGAVHRGPEMMVLFSKLAGLAEGGVVIAMLSAGLTLHLLTWRGLPASATQAVVGSVAGLGFVGSGVDGASLARIAACWVATPILGAVLGASFFGVLRLVLPRLIRDVRTHRRFVRGATVVSGCFGAYALGANNVANVTGAYVGVGLLTPEAAAAVGGVAIAIGALTYSRGVMRTVGERITALDPIGALAAVSAEAVAVHVFTSVGVPVSTSQAVVGAVAGVGILNTGRPGGRKELQRIASGWLATPTLAALLAVGMEMARRLWV